jgi:hypothetical protein
MSNFKEWFLNEILKYSFDNKADVVKETLQEVKKFGKKSVLSKCYNKKCCKILDVRHNPKKKYGCFACQNIFCDEHLFAACTFCHFISETPKKEYLLKNFLIFKFSSRYERECEECKYFVHFYCLPCINTNQYIVIDSDSD